MFNLMTFEQITLYNDNTWFWQHK